MTSGEENKPGSEEELVELLRQAKADMERPTLFNWAYRRQRKLDRAYVNGDLREARWIYIRWLGTILLGYAALFAGFYSWDRNTLVWPIAIFALAFYIAIAAATQRRVSLAYRSGWQDGRLDAMRTHDQACPGWADGGFETAVWSRDKRVIW